jgi:hypothetical protein
MSYKVDGQVVLVSEEQNPSGKFPFRELILKLDGPFPQEVSIIFGNRFKDLVTGITPKSEVTVSFELRGRSFTGKDGITRWNNQLAGYNIVKN